MLERTLVFLKPDAVQRGLVGRILTRFERPGLKIVAAKMMQVSEKLAKEHYGEHQGEKFFPSLINFITSAPIFLVVFEGIDAIANVRKIVGKTYPDKSEPGTIRGDYAHLTKTHGNKKNIGVPNLIHASSGKKAAKEEINRFFDKSEISSYSRCDDDFVI